MIKRKVWCDEVRRKLMQWSRGKGIKKINVRVYYFFFYILIVIHLKTEEKRKRKKVPMVTDPPFN